jgi:hypothetical protein
MKAAGCADLAMRPNHLPPKPELRGGPGETPGTMEHPYA